MNQLFTEFTSLPLWAQMMVVIIILFVGHFWLQLAGKELLERLRLLDSQYWILLKRVMMAMMIAYLLVSFWLNDGASARAVWGLWGRGAFILLTLWLTQFLDRYFKRY